MKLTFAVAALFFIPKGTLAYNEPNHVLITKQAILLLNKQLGNNFITQKEEKAIIEGNSSEDKFGHKWLARPWNQHFFNPVKPKTLWRRSKSIDVRFERIATRCLRKVHSKDFYFAVGEVVHHIQDATNPAHVVPVYHGGSLKDMFDEQPLAEYLLTAVQLNLHLEYATPFTSSILKPVAVKTLENIKNRFEVTVKRHAAVSVETMDWSAFWKDDPTKWFGTYGLLGAPEADKARKIDNYLEESITRAATSYSVDKKVYTDFSARQLELAVLHTANFIYHSKKMAARA